MTKGQFNSKTNELMANLNASIEKEVRRLADSGGIDIEGAEDNYLIPKSVLAVALENTAGQFRMAVNEELIENLRAF